MRVSFLLFFLSVEDENIDYNNYLKPFMSALNSSCDGILIADNKGRILYVNKSYEEMSGFEGNEIVGISMKDVVKDKIYKQKNYISAIERRKIVHHSQIFNKTNISVQISCNPIFSADRNISFVLSSVRRMDEVVQSTELFNTKSKLINIYNKMDLCSLQDDCFDNETIGNSLAMQDLMNKIAKIINFDIDILLEGETGTGKSTLAKYIYNKSKRANTGKFVEVNCGAIANNLAESELLGYEKGSFTGANNNGKIGLFEEADKGVIFLDEIKELSMDVQAKLLSVLQERKVRPIGSLVSKPLNFQVIAASNRSLDEMVKQGKFREDLYYRLNVIPIVLPALRDRREDIEPLANRYLYKYNEMYNVKKEFSPEIMDILSVYNWPGNLRELSNLIRSMVIVSKGTTIQPDDLPENIQERMSSQTMDRKPLYLSLNDLVSELEIEVINKALNKYGSLRKTADSLNITHSSLYRRMQKYNINVNC